MMMMITTTTMMMNILHGFSRNRAYCSLQRSTASLMTILPS